MADDLPTFAVVTPADADARRFIDVATIRSLTGIPETGSGALTDEALSLRLDGVLADAADYCRLAEQPGLPATLAKESVRATWVDVATAGCGASRGSRLLLPWRAPITAIAVNEAGIELVEGVDFRHIGAGVIERISNGVACGWSQGSIVVDYTAGWEADDEDYPPPANLVARFADQVRLIYFQGRQNPTLRSQDVPGVWSGTYSVAGGDTILASGRLASLEAALDRYRAPPSV